MPKLVISYRRKDTAAISGRIFEHLVKEFGKNSIFMDIDNIPPGVDYRNHIDRVLVNADIILVIIGDRWLGGSENNRILYDMDPVRIELESAYKQKIHIWPIFIDDGRMPLPEQLPPNLRNFVYLNAIYISSGRDFHSHMERLVRQVRSALVNRRSNFWLHSKTFLFSMLVIATLCASYFAILLGFSNQTFNDKDYQLVNLERLVNQSERIAASLKLYDESEVKNDTESVPCTQEVKTHSPSNSTNPIKLIFENHSGASKKLYRLNQAGDRQFFSDLDINDIHNGKGKFIVTDAFAGHPWVIASGSGSCEKILIPYSTGKIFLE